MKGAGLERLIAETRRVAARQRSLDKTLAAEAGRSVRPGDLFIVHGDPEEALQWLVLRLSGETALVVPADTLGVTGDGDLRVAEESTGSPLVLRCRRALRVDLADLLPELRSGTLAPADLEQARRLCERPAGGDAAAEPDSALEQWARESIEPAAAALAVSPSPVAPRAPGGRPRGGLGSRQLVAASILLLLITGLAGALVWQAGRAGRAEERAELAEARLRREALDRSRAEASLRRQLELRQADLQRRLERELAASEEARRSETEALRRRLEQTAARPPILNLPVVLLSMSDGSRALATPVELTAQTPAMALILALDPVAIEDSYELEVRHHASDRLVWSGSGLTAAGTARLSLQLPSSLLDADRYLLRLYAVAPDGGRGRLVGESLIEVRKALTR